jgi:GDP dissociation inhibitor
MLSKPDVEVVYSEEGVATGVHSEGETAKAKFVVGDPSELSVTCQDVTCLMSLVASLVVRKVQRHSSYGATQHTHAGANALSVLAG